MLLSPDDEAFLAEMKETWCWSRGQYASLLEITDTARRGEQLTAEQSAFLSEIETRAKERPGSTYARFVRIIAALRRNDFDARLTRIEEALKKAGLL